MKLFAAPLAWMALVSAAPLAPNSTEISDEIPPVRFRGGAVATVSMTGVEPCGIPPKGFKFLGCVRDNVIYMPNPCDVASKERYARILCHELAHLLHWPRTHGD